MFVYLLESIDKKRTYVGATVDLERRLKQHNKELSGGAKATSGNKWNMACFVSGFPDWRATLQFEWKWKNLTKKRGVGQNPLEKRMGALDELLHSDRSTLNAVPFSEWAAPPNVIKF